MKNNYLTMANNYFYSLNMLLTPNDYQLSIDSSDAMNIEVTLQLKETKETFKGKLPNDDDDTIGRAFHLHQQLISFTDVKIQLFETRTYIVIYFSGVGRMSDAVRCLLEKVNNDEKENMVNQQCINKKDDHSLDDIKKLISLENQRMEDVNKLANDLFFISKPVKIVLLFLWFLLLAIIYSYVFTYA